MTAFNYWHFITIVLLFLVYLVGIYFSLKQDKTKVKVALSLALSVIFIMMLIISVLAVDKYTKKVELYKFNNKRLLSIEKIVYTGIVKNEGEHKIGKVTLEIKIVNKARQMGPTESFFTPSGFKEFFGGGANVLYKPQSLKKTFVVAKDLLPGQARSFRVHFDYPPHFRNVSQFADVYGH